MPAILSLLLSIALIIVLTTRFRVHPFFALLLACFVVGAGLGMPLPQIISRSKEGFGHLLQSLGFVLALGTTLGLVLEHSGATRAMALFGVRRLGAARAPLAMSLTGYLVGLPIFCDSGYIVLSGLNNSLARSSAIPRVVMATALATGLYSVHCLIPPHPGAAAAATTLNVGYGPLILLGMLVAVPAMLVGYIWARYAGRRFACEEPLEEALPVDGAAGPPVILAVLPLLVPILLIGLRAFTGLQPAGGGGLPLKVLLALGDPVPALLVGILLALLCKRRWGRTAFSNLLAEGVEKAGGILMIIGAGGAFGAILSNANLGVQMMQWKSVQQLGLFLPFVLTLLLKTAQGSSTVAIITASAILAPLLPALGLEGEKERLFAVLAMGAGSMAISHANDAYFWVIGRFAQIPVKQMLQVYTVASILMALVAMLVIWCLYRLV